MRPQLSCPLLCTTQAELFPTRRFNGTDTISQLAQGAEQTYPTLGEAAAGIIGSTQPSRSRSSSQSLNDVSGRRAEAGFAT
jgi:hypothetical protein